MTEMYYIETSNDKKKSLQPIFPHQMGCHIGPHMQKKNQLHILNYWAHFYTRCSGILPNSCNTHTPLIVDAMQGALLGTDLMIDCCDVWEPAVKIHHGHGLHSESSNWV